MPDVRQLEKRQKALAEFGEFALRANDLDAVLNEACRLVAEALGTEHAKVLEIEQDAGTLYVRAGFGWNDGIVGRLRLSMTAHSSETYSIALGEPVITNDLTTEDRFDFPAFLKEAGVKALTNVPIFLPGGRAFGLLQVDASEPRAFDDDDSQFLRIYATILGPVIDRLLTVDALGTTEERFRTIVEAARDYAIIHTDVEDRITEWLPGAEAVFGWTADEAIGQPADILSTPEDRQAGVPEAEVATAQEQGSALDLRWHVHKDGRRVFIDGNTVALRNRQGELRGFQRIGQDVTKRRLADEVLRESEARHRLLIGSWAQAVWETDAQGVVISDSPSWRDYTGQSLEEWLGYGWLDAIHPEDRAYAERQWRQAMAARSPVNAEFRLHAPDGGWRWTNVRAAPVLDAGGNIQKWAGMNIDIDARKQAEAALRESKERLRALNVDLERQVIERTQARGRTWAVTPDLMGALNAEGYFETSNPAWLSMLGWSEDEVRRTSIWELLHPDDLERTREGFALTQIGEPAIQFPNRYRCRDGSYRWISWVGVPEDGMVYCTGREITLEREREAELVQAQEELRQSQKMEAMGQLTGGVAHDFNNLLTPVMMGLEMLRRSHDDTRSQKLIGGALQSAERAKTLIQRLLTFSRRQALEPRPVHMATLFANLRDLIDRPLGPTVDVLISVEDGLPAALIDPNQLELAILNLSVNARDAMPDGGILTIAVTSERILDGEDRNLAAGQYVRISISDNGCGMDRETLARSIEPFFSTKEVGHGTGLGLAMVHGLAAQSGGILCLKSEPGAGTEASLWVPATDQLAEVAPLQRHDAPTTERFATLLLVDDEELVRGFMAEGLRTLGYAVVEAASAAKALDHIASGLRPDMVVTDHMMPGMTGAQLAAKLRSIAPSVPVLMITGYANMTPGQTQGLEVLAKPFGHIELAERIESLFQSSKPTPPVSAFPSL